MFECVKKRMAGTSISGVPPDLDRLLQEAPVTLFSSEYSNLSIEQLRASVCEYTPRPQLFFPKSSPAETPPMNETYVFFPPSEGARLIPLWLNSFLKVPLSLDRYGFSGKTTEIRPREIPLQLSTAAQTQYSRMAGMGKIEIADMLETVGFVVNDSMEYDFCKMITIDRELGNDIGKWEQLRTTYRPSGKEMVKGICDDAGKTIRSILSSLGIDERLRFFYVGTMNAFAPHDTTAVFDSISGYWAVINSKSPTKPYNLVPPEKLGELGFPYAA